ncbi:MAG: hypothetical protein FWC53_04410 [Firmicutes bacterium]|nr:hypothetical protein [Bacillota bacterium]
MTVITGSGSITAGDNSYPISSGQSFIIPACLGEFSIEAEGMKIIKTYI